MDFCFAPYVHSLEWIEKEEESEEDKLVKATTRNLIAMQVETIFNPQRDVLQVGQFKTYRPFCNFQVKKDGKEMPFFVHPEMVHDEKLRLWLLGEELVDAPSEKENVLEKEGLIQGIKKGKKKEDDDDFL